MCAPYITVEGENLPRKAVHEAGHSGVAAFVSDDPVRIENEGTTDEDFHADGLCVHDWKQGEKESIRDLFKRRVAGIFASAIAESSFEAPEAVEDYALALWENSPRFRGDHAKVCRIFTEEMPSYGIPPDDAAVIRRAAWETALSAVLQNKPGIARIAKAYHAKGSLTNEEIRGLLNEPQQPS